MTSENLEDYTIVLDEHETDKSRPDLHCYKIVHSKKGSALTLTTPVTTIRKVVVTDDTCNVYFDSCLEEFFHELENKITNYFGLSRPTRFLPVKRRFKNEYCVKASLCHKNENPPPLRDGSRVSLVLSVRGPWKLPVTEGGWFGVNLHVDSFRNDNV